MATNNGVNVDQVLSIGTIVQLNGNNYKKWRADMDLYLLGQSLDWCLKEAEPVLVEDSTAQQKEHKEKWNRANRICILTIKKTLSDIVRGAIADKTHAGEYLKCITDKYQSSDKIESGMLLTKLQSMKFSMNLNIRKHIMQMINISVQLGDLGMSLDDDFMVYQVLHSLPDQFDSLQTTYNTQKDKWTLEELIAICVQEHERLKRNKAIDVNLITKPQWKNAKGRNQLNQTFIRSLRT
ncbi:uncharacterized protein LOC126801883 [Argentina anserina]|uniref:uncharacterized protein LOC126801883 n=1 Tax=Argentina anserina TaxID=57926 RepID=UPI0021764449|nr:uncharacterized protein LOC126801883 [Potentilla anserina]